MRNIGGSECWLDEHSHAGAVAGGPGLVGRSGLAAAGEDADEGDDREEGGEEEAREARGELDDADATVTTDYATAKALFVDQDQTVAMQAFMNGRIKVQGDMMKMMAMQTAIPSNEFTDTVAGEIKAITAD